MPERRSTLDDVEQLANEKRHTHKDGENILACRICHETNTALTFGHLPLVKELELAIAQKVAAFDEFRDYTIACLRQHLDNTSCPWIRTGTEACTCPKPVGVTESPPSVPHGEKDRFGHTIGRDYREAYSQAEADLAAILANEPPPARLFRNYPRPEMLPNFYRS